MSACAEPVPSSNRVVTPSRRAVASAPMRVSFAGGGSDLPPFAQGIGGRVIGSAIDLRVRAVVEPFDRGWARLEVGVMDAAITRRSGDPRRGEVAFRLLEAALAATGVDDGVRLRVETDLVPGAGLGGSASAAVAALLALRASVHRSSAPDELAGEAVRVERDGLGLACGSQDQLFAAFGGVLDLRYGDDGLCTSAAPRAGAAILQQIEAGMLLVDTGHRRVSGEVLDRGASSAAIARELVAGAGEVAQGLAAGSIDRVVAGMRRSAAAKIQRDPAASAPAVEIARVLRPLGAEVVRMCGAGSGGHVLVWSPEDRLAAILSALAGSGAIVRRPKILAGGARIEE